MGSCLSKKSACVSSSPPKPQEKLKSEPQLEIKKAEKETLVKKEIFVIKHRKSHEIADDEKKIEEVDEKSNGLDVGFGNGSGVTPVRASSCTKEEVDAILIQCGRLSRSSSAGKKYSGSKRSYDFDNEKGRSENNVVEGDDDAVARERENRRREGQQQGRRRTPSREREKEQRSGSRERGGRRVSRSPGRRSESPITTNCNSNSSNSKPGKMVSVPATVIIDKNSNGEANTVKRIQVKRNAASPRGIRVSSNEAISLSRSNSRKAEHSPYRRNPLAEIDTNIISQAPPIQKPNAEKSIMQGPENIINSNNLNCKNLAEETKGPYGIGGHVTALNVISSGPENLKTNAVTRSRSSRLSRDLDIIVSETLANPNAPSSYTALLLEDIQNFHHKNTTTLPAAFSFPPCVTKACSILEAVADLNSTNLSSEDQRRNPITEQMNKCSDNNKPSLAARKTTKPEIRDPILESEVVANDDLMEPSFHKYVTVRRGGATLGEDLEDQESSGSNSIAGSQQHWVSSSCWEPNSAESTDRWTSSSYSRSASRQTEVSPVGFQNSSSRGADDEGRKRLSTAKKRSSGRGRTGSSAVVAASST